VNGGDSGLRGSRRAPGGFSFHGRLRDLTAGCRIGVPADSARSGVLIVWGYRLGMSAGGARMISAGSGVLIVWGLSGRDERGWRPDDQCGQRCADL
jgi:hypothetical protein